MLAAVYAAAGDPTPETVSGMTGLQTAMELVRRSWVNRWAESVLASRRLQLMRWRWHKSVQKKICSVTQELLR